VSQVQARIREAVVRNRRDKLTARLHHLTVDVLRASFFGLKKSAAPGVDEMTWTAYADGLEGNLSNLHSRVQAGAYRALPSRRAYIPKPDGRQRPLGIAALEDKVVQTAVVAIVTPIYEAEFLGFSYGFRPKRNQHQALDALAFGIRRRRINWALYDLWVHQWRQRCATGDVVVVRYADDTIVGFEHRHEAERFLADLKARLARFGLTLHPDKTRLIEFGR